METSSLYAVGYDEGNGDVPCLTVVRGSSSGEMTVINTVIGDEARSLHKQLTAGDLNNLSVLQSTAKRFSIA